jgi:uncharacterized protein (TIGR02001 family)
MNPRRRPFEVSAAMVVAMLLGGLPARGAAGDWTGGMAATSDYVLRGVSQTDGSPALQGTLSYQADRGWYAGAWVSTLNATGWFHPAGQAAAELDVFAGVTRTLTERWAIDARAVRYAYPDDGAFFDYGYSELEVAINYRDTLRASVAWLPDATMVSQYGFGGNRTALAYELGVRQAVLPWMAVTAGIGYFDLDDLYSTGYAYWNVGLTARVGALTVDLGQYGSDTRGRELFGSHIAGPRTVLTLGIGF